MKELEYPFDAESVLKKKKSIKKQLLADETVKFIDKKIAILGGETTQNIKIMLELFLLNHGIRPQFYESEYNQYYEDGMFPNPELEEFSPDLIYVCTCIRNIVDFPLASDSKDIVDEKRQNVIDKFYGLWESLEEKYHCPIIQNNFEYPFFRLMGNKDASDNHGRVNFVTMLNCAFYDYAQAHDNFFICDVNYISASYGLDKWSDPYYWHMYKYAVAVPAIPYLSFNVANIIKVEYVARVYCQCGSSRQTTFCCCNNLRPSRSSCNRQIIIFGKDELASVLAKSVAEDVAYTGKDVCP